MNFFSDNIALEGSRSHAFLFAVATLIMIGSAAGIWLWGRRRGWY